MQLDAAITTKVTLLPFAKSQQRRTKKSFYTSELDQEYDRNVNARMRTEVDLNESEIDLNESEIDLNESEIDLNESEIDLNESEIDLNECEHFLETNLDESVQ